MRGYFRKTILNEDKELQAYVIGLALGDGNLSNPGGRATRLRITCDKKYPFLIKKICKSLEKLFPENKVNIVDRDKGCVDVSIYLNHFEKLLGWKAKNGSKFVQKVSVPNWIKENKKYSINCLRGLIETDGAIYNDRGYKMMIFTSIIPDLAEDFYNMVIFLGFKPHIYKIKPKKTIKYNYNQQDVYHIRLSKNVSKFLELVRPEKV
jgi:DNA-binding transcriptional regulator WhiA